MVDSAQAPQDEPVAGQDAPEGAQPTDDATEVAIAPTGAQDAPPGDDHPGYRVGEWAGIPHYIADADGYNTFDESEMRRRLGLPPR